jgi:hypothetical protein
MGFFLFNIFPCFLVTDQPRHSNIFRASPPITKTEPRAALYSRCCR